MLPESMVGHAETAIDLALAIIPGKVHVSEQTRILASSRYGLEARGSVLLRGLPAMTTYFVADGPAGGNGKAPRI